MYQRAEEGMRKALAHWLMPAAMLGLFAAIPAQGQDNSAVAPIATVPVVPEGAVGGMGDINLYPKRIVIDRRQRIATVGLYNRSIETGEYEISIIDMVMTPDGGVFQLDNLPPGVSADRLKAASEMLRWSPRRVSLRGNEAQTVRIMARQAADLPDGEYRSHFMVVSVPQDVDQGYSITDAIGSGVTSGDNIGVTIRPRFGLSIPVIVRIGDTTLEVGLHDIRLVQTDAGSGIALIITRSGTRSAYGDIVVTAPGQDIPVAIARGVGVYPEIDSRTVVLPFNSEFDTAALRSGLVLTVTYTDDDFAPGNMLARQDFTVQ